MKNKTIEISSKKKKELVEEFGKSLQTIQMSLRYVFNSDSAKKIRQRAKEMLLAEAASINENKND